MDQKTAQGRRDNSSVTSKKFYRNTTLKRVKSLNRGSLPPQFLVRHEQTETFYYKGRQLYTYKYTHTDIEKKNPRILHEHLNFFFWIKKKKVFFNKIKCNLQYICVRINVESGALLFLCFIEILKMKNTTEVRRKHKRSYLKVVEILQRLLWHCQGSWLNVNQTSISHGIVFNFLEKKSQLCCKF